MNTPIKNLSPRKLHSIREDVSDAHDEYQVTLLRRALFKTSDSELSQDLVQTTFLKTFLYLRRGGKIELMRSFLNHVLGDLIVDEYRKTKPLSLDVLLEKGFEPKSDEYQRNADILDGKQIVLLLPQLPKKYEQVIRLRYLKNLSLKEVSLLTEQSENTVAVQVHRGIQKLRKLQQDGIERAQLLRKNTQL